MKKLFWLLLRLGLLVLLVLVGIVVVRTMGFSSKQIEVAAVKEKAVPEGVVERLSESIQIPTLSYFTHVDTASLLDFKAFVQRRFARVDSLLVRDSINPFSIIYKWPGRKPALDPVLMIAHIDVVPVEGAQLGQWAKPPYSGLVEDGYIWGRGALDDKLSVLGLLEAVDMLLAEGYRPERGLYLAFGHDEEVRGLHGAKMMAKHFEAQGVRFEYVLDEGSLMVSDAFDAVDKPVALIGIAEKGYVTLEVRAKIPSGGHSSMPPEHTAIGLLSKAISYLEAEPFPAKVEGATALLFDYLGPEMSWGQRAVFANNWLFGGLVSGLLASSPGPNAMIRTTTAPTILAGGVKENVLPTEAVATVNFRILPGETPESVLAEVQRKVGNEYVSAKILDGYASSPSPVSSTESFGFEVIQRSIREIFPEVVIAPALVIAATDSRYYSNVSDNIYRFLPVLATKADLKRIHGIDERISVESYYQVVRFYYQLIGNSCS